MLSTSYYAIKLLSNNRYGATVPVKVLSNDTFGPAYYVAGVSDPGKYTFKVAIYNSTGSVPFNIKFDGVKKGQKAHLTTLSATGPGDGGLSSNVLVDGKLGPEVVQETTQTLHAGKNGEYVFELGNYQLAVLTT